MAIPPTVQAHLQASDIPYDLVVHQPTSTSLEAAETAQVPGGKVAKAVLVDLPESGDALVVLLPATRKLNLGRLRQRLDQQCALGTRDDIARRFPDCDVAAVPACAEAYGLSILVDERLLHCDPVYLESGNPAALIRVSGADFRRLMGAAASGSYGDDTPRSHRP
jgi:Ala-tRNA(Pro) deacylase